MHKIEPKSAGFESMVMVKAQHVLNSAANTIDGNRQLSNSLQDDKRVGSFTGSRFRGSSSLAWSCRHDHALMLQTAICKSMCLHSNDPAWM